MIYLDDFGYIILKVRTNSIKTVKGFFFLYDSLINAVYFIICNFTVRSTACFLNKSFVVVLIALIDFYRVVFYCLSSTFYLRVADFTLIIPVFDGVGYNKPLFKIIFFDPTLLVKNSSSYFVLFFSSSFIYHFIKFRNIIDFIATRKFPAICRKSPFFQVFF